MLAHGPLDAGTADMLTDWSFFVGNRDRLDVNIPVSGNVGLVVARWDGQHVVGPALYTSPAFAFVDGAARQAMAAGQARVAATDTGQPFCNPTPRVID